MKTETILDHVIDSMYNKYLDHVKTIEEPDYDFLIDDPREHCIRELNKDEFKHYIVNNALNSSWRRILL
jgi:hypothetical protein